MSEKNALFFARKCIFWFNGRGKPLLFRVLEVDGVLLTQVFHHFRWEEFGCGTDAVGFQKSAIAFEPTAKGLGTDTRRAGKFGFGIRTHILLVG